MTTIKNPPFLATAHIEALSLDVLVTIWEDGTGEVTYRDGPGQYGIRWSPPSPLVVAP
jgi:hypothetical protein